MSCRLAFETDVASDYFSRDIDQGEFSLFIVSDSQSVRVRNYTLNLQNGMASLSLQLPDNCRVGDRLRFIASVEDRTQIEPFSNCFVLTVKEVAESTPGKAARGRRPPGDKEGLGREMPSGIQLPRISEVHENPFNGGIAWNNMPAGTPFNKYSALRVISRGDSGGNAQDGDGTAIYDFYVNVDNVYLKAEQKSGGVNPDIMKARFVYGMVLLGMGLLHQEAQTEERNSDEGEDGSYEAVEQTNTEDRVEEFTQAVAPVLLPMIDHLGGLDVENGTPLGASGEAT